MRQHPQPNLKVSTMPRAERAGITQGAATGSARAAVRGMVLAQREATARKRRCRQSPRVQARRYACSAAGTAYANAARQPFSVKRTAAIRSRDTANRTVRVTPSSILLSNRAAQEK